MKATDERYYTSLNKAINLKSKIGFYSCVKRLSIIRGISLKRAYWLFLKEY